MCHQTEDILKKNALPALIRNVAPGKKIQKLISVALCLFRSLEYLSNFNFERNTEVGFKESLGLHVLLFLTFPKICFKLQTHTAMYNPTKRQD